LAADLVPRLGVDVVRYTFIVVDLHLLLLAGLPAHIGLGGGNVPAGFGEHNPQAKT
jgi:hypothetical protein